MRVLLFLTAFLILLSSGCIKEEGKESARTCFEDGFCVKAEVVREPEEMQRGLMFREGLAEDEGMLFVFPQEGVVPFWMKNMLFPIDIIWISEEKLVVHIERDVPPCREDPCPSYPPKGAALYVLEVPANQTLKHSVKEGSRIGITF
jgi:uncharacterized membrane protein (UPF0127 family)